MSARFVATTGINAAARGVAPLASSIQVLGSSGTASSVTTGTSETQLAVITVPANAMGKNGSVRITTLWSFTNSANNKTLRVRFGGSGGTPYFGSTFTTSATFWDPGRIVTNNNATNSQKGYQGTSPGSNGSAMATGSVDTTAATTIYISGQTASSGETITLEYYCVELIPSV